MLSVAFLEFSRKADCKEFLCVTNLPQRSRKPRGYLRKGLHKVLLEVMVESGAGQFRPNKTRRFGGQDMKYKTLLLGTAAVFAVATGARAADLAVAESVEYVKVCDAY